MARLLFVSWGGAGNQAPAIGLAAALAERGHTITVAGYPEQRGRFSSYGFEFRELPRARHAWPTTPRDDWMPVLVDAVWACGHHLRDLPELAADGNYDLLVVDCLMFGALAAAESAGLPTAVLVHSAPGALVPPGGGLDHLARHQVNAVRADAGLEPVPALWEAWRPFPALCTSVAELDPPAGPVPGDVTFVGPVFEPFAARSWRSPWPPGDHRPLALVSFSTGGAWDQTGRIRRAIEALDDGEHRVLVTTGPFTVDVPASDAVVLTKHVPHGAVLPEVSVVITHAGHGTVAAALSHGVPLVCLPNAAADQPALAARVAQLGAGIALDGDGATAGELAEAVRTVLGEHTYAERARELAAVIEAAAGAGGAAARLEALLGPPRATISAAPR